MSLQLKGNIMEKKFPRILREEWIFILLILFATILFWMPEYAPGFTNGAEIGFHYTRIMTLVDSLKEGIFPAKVRPSHMKGFGYGIGFFYPDLMIYPPAVLILLGAEYDITVKAYLILVTFILGLVTYRCFKEITGSKWIALVGDILVINSFINDHNIFFGAGMPHLFAYLFLPLALCGLLRALKNEKGGCIEYAVGITMVLLTHNMIFLTMMFAMLVIVILHAKEIIKTPAALAKLVGVSLVALVVTTAYWLPAMEQIVHIDFIVFNDNAYEVKDHILEFGRLVTYYLGIPYSVLFAASVVLYFVMVFRKRKMPADITAMLISSIFIIFFMCSKAVWNSPVGDVLSFFEYTNRFVFVLTVMVVIFMVLTAREALDEFSIGIDAVCAKKIYLPAVICVLIIIATRFAVRPGFFNPAGEDRVMLSYSLLEETWQVSGAEWLPVECEPSECKNPENARASDGSSADGFKHDHSKYFEVWVGLDRDYYDMPYVYYYGYHAYILDENDNPVQELRVGEAFDDNGYVRVYTPEDQDGIAHVMTIYRKTAIQKVSYVVTFVSVLALCAVWIITIFKRKQAR